MHNASTKQRLSALRRRLGIFTGWQPRWVKERRRRLERLARAAGSGTVAPEAPPPADEAPAEVASAHPHDPPPSAVAPEPDPAPPRPTTATPSLPRQAAAATEPPRRTHAAPASATHAAPARPTPPATLVAPGRRQTGRAARGAAVALAVVALAAAGFLALGRRGANAPAASRELERASGRDAVVLAATAPTPAPAPAAAPLARGPRGDERVIAPDPSVVQVRPGDTLWRLAAVHLGDPMRWPELHAVNARLIRDPDLIFPGQRLDVPPSARGERRS